MPRFDEDRDSERYGREDRFRQQWEHDDRGKRGGARVRSGDHDDDRSVDYGHRGWNYDDDREYDRNGRGRGGFSGAPDRDRQPTWDDRRPYGQHDNRSVQHRDPYRRGQIGEDYGSQRRGWNEPYGLGYDRNRGLDHNRRDRDRDWSDRAADEVKSWFGDDEAERRREQDHRGRGPRNYKRSDTRIEEDVNDRLNDDSRLDASDIEVSVSDQEVTLSGTVDSKSAKRWAEDCADSVSGVKHVQNNLRVAQSGTTQGDSKTVNKKTA